MLLIMLIILIAIIAGIVVVSKKNEEYKKKKYGAEQYERMREEEMAKTIAKIMVDIRIHDEKKEYKKQKRAARKNAIVDLLIVEDIINRINKSNDNR